MKKMMKKLIAMAAALVMIVTLLPAVGTKAEGVPSIDESKNGQSSITITKKSNDNNGDVLPGAEFTYYKIATIKKNQSGQWIYEVDSKYSTILGVESGKLNELDSAKWESQAIVDRLADVNDTTGVTGTTDDAGKITWGNLSFGIYLIKETKTPENHIASRPFIIALPTTNNYSNNVEGNGEDDWTVGTSWVYDVSATPKNTSQSVDKKVTSGDTSVAVGDTVAYEITTTIPTYSSEYTDHVFKIYDTMTEGLTFNKDSLKVYINNEEIKDSTSVYELFTDEKLNEDDDDIKTFIIDFAENYVKNNGGKAVKVTYSATVNEKAVYVNNNKAGISYKNNPDSMTDATTDGTDVPVYSYGINLTKNDASNKKTLLNGATFTLVDKTGAEIKFSYNNGTIFVEKDNTSEDLATVTVAGKDGQLVINGLDEGTYVLTEIQSPKGYTLLANPIEITIKAQADGMIDENQTKVDNQLADVENGVINITVSNQKGFSLPETGGMGTYLFTIGGIVIMAGAAFALIAMKKRA